MTKKKAEPMSAEARTQRTLASNLKRQAEDKARFLEKLRETRNVTQSCKLAGVGYTTVYEWREADKAFAEAWAEARRAVVDDLEASAIQRAIYGTRQVVLHQGKPVMVPDPAGGPARPLIKTEFETALTIFSLKKLKPELWSDDARNLGGLTPEQFAERARKAMSAIHGLTVKVQVVAAPEPAPGGDAAEVADAQAAQVRAESSEADSDPHWAHNS